MNSEPIKVAKRTPEYRKVRSELAGAAPSDVWQEAGLWFVAFDLQASVNAVVLFVIYGADMSVVAIQRVIFDVDKKAAMATDLRA